MKRPFLATTVGANLHLLVMLALLARAMVPAGFMPGNGGLVLCQGYAPLPVKVASDSAHAASSTAGEERSTENQDKSHDSGRSHFCPFLAATVALASPSAPMSLAHVDIPRFEITASLSPERLRSLRARTLLPRGPPSLLS